MLALVRSGNTPKEGKYAKEVAKGIEFICTHVQNSDDKSLYVTNIKGTQIQSKIGPYVDTFLASMVLAELKGKMADDKVLTAARDRGVMIIFAPSETMNIYAGSPHRIRKERGAR